MSAEVIALVNYYARNAFSRHVQTVCNEVLKKRAAPDATCHAATVRSADAVSTSKVPTSISSKWEVQAAQNQQYEAAEVSKGQLNWQYNMA